MPAFTAFAAVSEMTDSDPEAKQARPKVFVILCQLDALSRSIEKL